MTCEASNMRWNRLPRRFRTNDAIAAFLRAKQDAAREPRHSYERILEGYLERTAQGDAYRVLIGRTYVADDRTVGNIVQ